MSGKSSRNCGMKSGKPFTTNLKARWGQPVSHRRRAYASAQDFTLHTRHTHESYGKQAYALCPGARAFGFPAQIRHEVETEKSSSSTEDSAMVEEGDEGCADKGLQTNKDARGCLYCSHECFMVDYDSSPNEGRRRYKLRPASAARRQRARMHL